MDVFHFSGYRASVYAFPPLLASAAAGLLALRVWRDKHGALATGPFVLMTLPFSIWMAGVGFMLSARAEHVAFFWAKALLIGVPFIPASVYQFWTALLRVTRRRRHLVAALWCLSAIFALAALATNALIVGLDRHPWGYYPRYGWLGTLLVGYFFGTFAVGLVDLWVSRRHARRRGRASRVPAFLAAFGIAALSAVDFLPAYGIDLYPFGSLFVLGFLWLAARAIRSYGLVDITPAYAARQVMDTMLEGLFVCDAQGEVRLVNHAATAMVGLTAEDLLGRPLESLVDGHADVDAARLREALVQGGSGDQEYVLLAADGRRVHVSVAFSRLRPDAAGAGTIVVARDVTQLKHAEQQIIFHAYHDVLTGLPNHSRFLAELGSAVARAERRSAALAVMAVGLDQFPLLIESLGHARANELVTRVAERIRRSVRQIDIVARIGDGEFAVLLGDLADSRHAPSLARKLLDAVAEPLALPGQDLRVTAGIGVALFPGDGPDVESLMKAADTALHRAREAGRNSFQMSSPEMNRRAAERLAMESSLHQALEREELVLHYQPIIDTATGDMVAVEALLRWQHPQRGRLYPRDFIHAAEESDLIVPIGEWALRTACKQAVRWHRDGLTLRVTVNVSLKQVRQRRFGALVADVLAKSGLAPRFLEIEITESTAAADAEATVALLRALRDLGVSVSIDDFGTGYSSLSYLKRFPVTAIKIDRSFVRDVPESASDAAVVTAIVTIARALQLGVIAEGVETVAQMEFLRAQGCDVMQGFLFSQAVPAEVISSATAGGLLIDPASLAS